jgi:hypothetical protein
MLLTNIQFVIPEYMKSTKYFTILLENAIGQ